MATKDSLYLSVDKIKELDRRATEEFDISVERLMENAGKAVAEEAIKFLEEMKIKKPWKILALCGGGNNGGDGMVSARLLYQRGCSVTVVLFKNSTELKGATKVNFLKLAEKKIPCLECPAIQQLKIELAKADLLIDALFGIGLSKAVSQPFPQIIEEMNASGKPIFAVDLPSGLNGDNGEAQGSCVKATTTVTLGAMKNGFLTESSKKWTGKIVLADIGYPEELLPIKEE